MKLDKECYAKVIEALEAADVEPFRYSGRSMGGRDCVGVQVYDAMSFLMELSVSVCENATDVDEARDTLSSLQDPKADSLGRQGVVYWPSIEWQEPEEESADDEEETSVKVNVEDYEGAHGHEPGGTGEWMFCFGAPGEPFPDSWAGRETFSHNGSYAQAKKAAVARARELGQGKVYVLS